MRISNIKLSIIVPTYNAEKYIKRCICSIENQEYDNYELIIVDDGSSDNTKRIVEDLMRFNSRIKLICKTHDGPFHSRLVGINNASGDYVLFCDADDWFHEVAFRTIVYNIQMTNCDLLFFQYRKISDNNEQKSIEESFTITEYQSRKDLLKKVLFDNKYNSLWRKAFKITLLQKAYCEKWYKLRRSEDLIMSMYAYLNCNKCVEINSSLYLYYNNKDGTMNSKDIDILKIPFDVEKTVLEVVKVFLDEADVIEYHKLQLHYIATNVFNAECSNNNYNKKIDYYEEIRRDSYLGRILGERINISLKDRVVLFFIKNRLYKLFHIVSKFYCYIKKQCNKVK